MNRPFLSDLAFVTPRRGSPLPGLFCAGGEAFAPAVNASRPALAATAAQPQGTVLVLNDDAEARSRLDGWLRAQGFAVCFFASTGELFTSLKADGPACLLLDLELGDHDASEVLTELRRRKLALPAIILSGHSETTHVVKAMRLGAFDYLTKPHEPEALRETLCRALAQSARAHLSPGQAEAIRRRATTLTAREQAILRLVLAGKLNKQVADELGLALVTVKLHRARAMRKLGLKTAAELGRVAYLIDHLPEAGGETVRRM